MQYIAAAVVRHLVASHACGMQERDEAGVTALMLAAAGGHVEATELLLQQVREAGASAESTPACIWMCMSMARGLTGVSVVVLGSGSQREGPGEPHGAHEGRAQGRRGRWVDRHEASYYTSLSRTIGWGEARPWSPTDFVLSPPPHPPFLTSPTLPDPPTSVLPSPTPPPSPAHQFG